MRIVVYPHDLKMGGSQLNAVEIGAALQRRGHELVVFGQRGPLVEHLEKLGLEFVESPRVGRRPSPAAINSLRRLVKQRGIDVLHGYEWPPSLECYLAAKRLRRTIAVSTVMSMQVAPFIPKHLPLCVGTELIAQTERDFGRTHVSLMEPPVDTSTNQPGLVLGQEDLRRRLGLKDEEYTVVMVSRLAHELKLEGILTAMESMRRLSSTLSATLAIAGDGPAWEEVRHRAEEINNETGRRTILLAGELSDPRPLYDIADVCLGMGGSALRAMAFGKPLVVQGEEGFWELLDRCSLPTFLWQGWYGKGNGPRSGADKLHRLLQELLPAERLRRDLGYFGQQVVRERFSLHAAGNRQLEIYQDAANSRSSGVGRVVNEVTAAFRYASYKSRRLEARITGREASDDFNSHPLTGSMGNSRSSG